MKSFKQRATIAICSALMFGLVTNASAQKAAPLERATLKGDELIQMLTAFQSGGAGECCGG
jgi:hypothetical protein